MTVSLSTQILILAIFILVSILCEFALLPDVYILLSPQEVHSSSTRKRCAHLTAHSLKRLSLLSVIILVCLGNTQKKTARQTTLPLVLLVYNFDSYWWIGPISSITLSNVNTKRINNKTQTSNSTVLWWFLW